MPAIHVANLVKTYGKTEAVKDISFSVAEGEIFGYLGENGAGKTTTISCMMDFLRPTSGSISLLNKDAQKQAVELKNDIGYMSDTLSLHDKWTGKEHIQFSRRLNGKINISDTLLERLNLDPNIPTKNLSSGNRQKLGIILAFMHQPKLLILDEPSSALDPLMQSVLYELIRESAAHGSTVFMSSHNLAEIEKVCGRVGILRHGQLAAIESIDALKQKRVHVISVSFVDSIAAGEFNLPGLEITEQRPDGLTLRVRGALQPILSLLAQKKIRNLEVGRASLEAIFMEYYRD